MSKVRTSTQIAVQMSEKRSQVAKLREGPAEGQSADEHATAMNESVAELAALEPEYRAALAMEATELENLEVPTETPERRELRALEKRAEVGEFVGAAIEGRSVKGASLEFSQAVGSGGRFPLRLLAPETEKRATTDTESGVNQGTWLDRLFFGTAAQQLGISMRSVASGVASYPVTTAGASGAQRGRSEAIADAAWTVGVTEIKPTRNGVRAKFNIEDAARLSGLEEALRRDLRAALVEKVDRTIFVGDALANENPADITGLQTAAITEFTLTQANKLKGDKTLEKFAALVDGMHAMSLGDLNVVTSVGVNTLWLSTIMNSAADNQTVAQFLMASGLSWTARGGIDANTANGDFGAFVGLSRGIDGAGVSAMWDTADLIRDPYSGASTGEVAITLSTLWGLAFPRTANFQRLKFVA